MYKPFLFLLFSWSLFAVNAQTSTIGVTLDCATNDTVIYSAGFNGCDSLLLTGPNSSSYRIKSCLISFVKDGSVYEYANNGNDASSLKGLLPGMIRKDKQPGKLFVEKLVIVPVSGGNEIRISKRFRFYVKS